MTYEWDEEKNRANKAKHGIGFEAMEGFLWRSAVTGIDDDDYGELREFADGFIGLTLYRVVFTQRGEAVRIISLRKATRSESANYAKEI